MMRTVQFGIGNAYAIYGGLYDHILLGMEAAAYLMPLARWNAKLLTQTAHIKTMGQARRRTIIAGGENAAILDGNRPHPAAATCGATADKMGNPHKIIRPRKTLRFKLCLHHACWLILLLPCEKRKCGGEILDPAANGRQTHGILVIFQRLHNKGSHSAHVIRPHASCCERCGAKPYA